MKQDERKALIGNISLIDSGIGSDFLVPPLPPLVPSNPPRISQTISFDSDELMTTSLVDSPGLMESEAIEPIVITVLSLLAVMIFIPMAAYHRPQYE